MSKESIARMEAAMIKKLFDMRGAIKSPICSICQKPVEQFGVTYRVVPMIYVFEIKCHGDKGEMYIPEDMALDPKLEFQVNEAFTLDQARVDGIVKGSIQ